MDDAYHILNITPDSTPSDLLTSYKKLTLKHHPDRKDGDLKTYLQIKKAYELLLTKSQFTSLYQSFKSKYQDSDEEYDDLARLYTKHRGNIKKIIDNHILSEYIDEDRIRTMIEKLIMEKRLKRTKEFIKKIPKRLKKKKNEEMEKMIGAMLCDSERRRKEFVEKMERKYVNNLEYEKKE